MRFLFKFQPLLRLEDKTRRFPHAYILIAAILSFVSLFSVMMSRAGQATASSKSSAAETHGVDLAIIDKTCKPCVDFYNYANGE